MQLTLTSRNVQINPELKAWIDSRLRFALGRFNGSIGRVKATLADANGPRGGLDKQVQLEAGLLPRGRAIVEVVDNDMEAAVSRAAERLARRVRDVLERRRDTRRRRRDAAELN